MSAPYLTRATLRDDVTVKTLAPLLLGTDGGSAVAAGHRLMWYLFAAETQQERDFLWRSDGKSSYITLSRRAPQDPLGIFDLAPPKPLVLNLEPGDLLRFVLRANAIVRLRLGKGGRSVKHDVVTHALLRQPGAEKIPLDDVASAAGLRWLRREGCRAGFVIDEGRAQVGGLRKYRLPRPGQGRDMRFTALEMEGVLRVVEPDLLAQKVAQGFGSARAFGCGLMLLQRAYMDPDDSEDDA